MAGAIVAGAKFVGSPISYSVIFKVLKLDLLLLVLKKTLEHAASMLEANL